MYIWRSEDANHARRVITGARMEKAVEARLAAFALDALAIAVIATDQKMRLHYANAAADRLLNDPAGALRQAGGMVLTADAARRCVLKQAIDRASAKNHVADEGLLMIPAVADGRDIAACVLAIDGDARVLPHGPTVMLFAREIDRDCDLRNEARRIFGLTGMEANFASAIASGSSLAGAAHAHNVQLSTARWHLKHIFEKTGTRQQSQVAALLRGAQIPVQVGR